MSATLQMAQKFSGKRIELSLFMPSSIVIRQASFVQNRKVNELRLDTVIEELLPSKSDASEYSFSSSARPR